MSLLPMPSNSTFLKGICGKIIRIHKKWNSYSIAFKLLKLQSLFSFLILHHFPVTTANLFDDDLSLDRAFRISKSSPFR